LYNACKFNYDFLDDRPEKFCRHLHNYDSIYVDLESGHFQQLFLENGDILHQQTIVDKILNKIMNALHIF